MFGKKIAQKKLFFINKKYKTDDWIDKDFW